MNLDKHMKELAKELEIEGNFATELPGVYVFPLDEGLTITITQLQPGMSFTSNVNASPKANLEAFYSQMLLANLWGQGTRGAVLGLSDDSNLLTLSKAIEYNIDYKEFRETLEDFINAVDFWREEAVNHK